MNRKRTKNPPSAVRRIMRKHGLSEPAAWSYAFLAYGEAALHG
ncbi:hypothetical protein [Pseudosulfitobacter sp. SM2401]